MRRITSAGIRRRAVAGVDRLFTPVRARYYRGEWQFVGRLPRPFVLAAGLDDLAAIHSRKVEIGGGPYPTPGYVHVDIGNGARHLEHRSPAWTLPFASGWAEEILAVHSLEHVHPSAILKTLREWHRVLLPGGRLEIHVPNTPDLFNAFVAGDVRAKWALNGAILGMSCPPTVADPQELTHSAQHQILFDFPLLDDLLARTQFVDVVDCTSQLEDRHSVDWALHLESFSLIVTCRKPSERLAA